MLYSVPFDKFSSASTYTPLTVIFVLYYIIILESENFMKLFQTRATSFSPIQAGSQHICTPRGEMVSKETAFG